MTDSLLKLGEFTYDPVEKVLANSAGEEPELRPQSLAVLQLLASRPGKVIAKNEFFTTVWPGVTVTDDSLVQCIGDVRRVLGDDNRKILKTVPRRGYVLQAGTCLRDDSSSETATKVNRWEDRASMIKEGSADVVRLEGRSYQGVSAFYAGNTKKVAFGFVGLAVLSTVIWVGGYGDMVQSGSISPNDSGVDSVAQRFINTEKGVVLDKQTKVIWKKCSEGLSGENCEGGKIKKYTWDDAMKLNDSTWRLPSIEELRTLVYCDNNIPAAEALNKSCVGAEKKGGKFSRPTIHRQAFPNTGSGRYWSSTVYRFDFEAWVVSFYEGTHSALDKKQLRRVRLVRRSN